MACSFILLLLNKFNTFCLILIKSVFHGPSCKASLIEKLGVVGLALLELCPFVILTIKFSFCSIS